MKRLLVSALATSFFGIAPHALASQIDLRVIDLPWMNGPNREARYSFGDEENTNKVHVFEAFTLSCSYCNSNAAQVKAMAAEYGSDERVQFLDLGLDANDNAIRTWINRHKPSYPVVKDVGRQIYNAFKSQNAVPQTFVVACDGTLIGATLGYWEARDKAALQAAIATAKETVCE